MAMQYRYTVSVLWNGSLTSVIIDASTPEKAARVAFERHYPRHDKVWVYDWANIARQTTQFARAERGKVKEIFA